jgi:uncharacterized protein (TIGR02444 family)
VETACLELQAHGGDVCLALCGTWLQARNVAVDSARLDALRALAQAWQAPVIAPLRALRTQWKAQAALDPALADLREQVKALELSAERLLLERLEGLANGWASDAAPAQDWLEGLMPVQLKGHDVLERLRVAARALQASDA